MVFFTYTNMGVHMRWPRKRINYIENSHTSGIRHSDSTLTSIRIQNSIQLQQDGREATCLRASVSK